MHAVSIQRFSRLFVTEWGGIISDVARQQGLPEGVVLESVDTSSDHCAAVAVDGDLYMWGCVAQGFSFPVLVGDRRRCAPMHVPRALFGGSSVEMVSLGDMHTCVLAGRRLYTCGYGGGGRLGRCRFEREHGRHAVFPFARVDIAVPVVYVAAGSESSGVVCCDGSVWTWGPNYRGECGPGDACLVVPTRVAALGDAAQIYMHDHVVVRTADGSLFAWGQNVWGELGLGDREPRLLPARLLHAPPMLMAACGCRHTLFLTTEGAVLGCGSNEHCGVGLGAQSAEIECVLTPTPAVGVPRAVSVAAGVALSVAVTSEGTVFEWGLLRSMHEDTSRPDPVLLELPARVGLYGHGMPPGMALALAMGTHARLGDGSVLRTINTDSLRKVAEAWVVHPPR